MENRILEVLNQYLEVFPEEKERQEKLKNYLETHQEEEAIDWNNFDGHIVASVFVYAKNPGKFLVLYHKDRKCFLYPGGHVNSDDKNILEAARREVQEETGILDLKEVKISLSELVPIDIDTHQIPYNERLDLKEHIHFDFRYLFMIDEIPEIHIDQDELSEYKWVSMEELKKNIGNQIVLEKIDKITSKEN
ncbi:MAG: NUDIX domain-containing protein [Bacilli bacterium]|nr:NUDIX domain-containing protein [Bacilli bacterium]